MPRIIPTFFVAFLLWLTACGAAMACAGACSTGGAIQYCSGTMKYCNGTTWTDLPSVDAGASCSSAGNISYSANKLRFCSATALKYPYCDSSPATDGTCSSGGQIAYDATNTRLEFCNGTNWIAMSACGGGGGGSTHQAYCWGSGTDGQIGDGNSTARSTPTLVLFASGSSSLSWKKISTSSSHACAIDNDNALFCWGSSGNGKLGNGDTSGSVFNRAVAVTLPSGVTSWKAVTTGGSSSCAIGNNDLAYCWGFQGSGALGNGVTSGDQATPSQVTLPSGVTSWKSIGGGNSGSCAIGNNDLLYCWGSATFGVLGNGTTTPAQSTPVQVTLPSGVTSWTYIGEGLGFLRCAIGNNGLAYCWGTNGNGNLGNGDTTAYSTPQQVVLPSGVTSWTRVTNSGTVSCGIGNNAQAYCWGNGSSGAMGNGASNITNSSPQIVTLPSGVTGWTEITAGTNGACAVANTGDAYCWGAAANGRLGNGTTTPNVDVPSLATKPGGVTSFDFVSGRSGTHCGFTSPP